MKRHLHNLRHKIDGLQFGLAEGACDFVFENFGDGPEDGAHDRADQPHVPEQLSFDARIEMPIEINIAAILHAQGGGANFEVVGMNDAVSE